MSAAPKIPFGILDATDTIDYHNQSTLRVFQCIVDLLEKKEWNQTNKNKSSLIGYQILELISGNLMSFTWNGSNSSLESGGKLNICDSYLVNNLQTKD